MGIRVSSPEASNDPAVIIKTAHNRFISTEVYHKGDGGTAGQRAMERGRLVRTGIAVVPTACAVRTNERG
jgi:hypothetical protein